ncbi:MAG: Crp/Fnr family transcriptional regulator [Chitinophagaceae bacterium]|jgi:CRP-like cAMP-binding protein|nr:Crp/Fnr family transcriptional regulator [Chitinophagaceae bacterium]
MPITIASTQQPVLKEQSPLASIDLLLSMGATYQSYKKGEIIFKEGAYCRYYHQLVSGTVVWHNVDDLGKEIIQAIIVPGESFGELPLFDDKPYAAGAVAMQQSLVLRLPKELFLELLKEDYDMHMALNRKMAERLRFKFMLLQAVSQATPEGSICMLLNYLKQEQKHICTGCGLINLTRQQIADLLGLRVETVIRVTRRLHEEGRLLIENRKLFYV